MRYKSKFDPTNPNDVIRARRYFHSDNYTYCSNVKEIGEIKPFSLVYVQYSDMTLRNDAQGVFHINVGRKLIVVFGKAQREKIKCMIKSFGIVAIARPKDWIGLIRFSIQDKKEIKKMINGVTNDLVRREK